MLINKRRDFESGAEVLVGGCVEGDGVPSARPPVISTRVRLMMPVSTSCGPASCAGCGRRRLCALEVQASRGTLSTCRCCAVVTFTVTLALAVDAVGIVTSIRHSPTLRVP